MKATLYFAKAIFEFANLKYFFKLSIKLKYFNVKIFYFIKKMQNLKFSYRMNFTTDSHQNSTTHLRVVLFWCEPHSLSSLSLRCPSLPCLSGNDMDLSLLGTAFGLL